MTSAIDALAGAVQRARERAKEILAALEQQGHPQTNQSSSLYLGLVALQKRIAAAASAGRAPDALLLSDLEQLARTCDGKLAELKPLLEAATSQARKK